MATQYDVSFLNAANRILDKFGVPATLIIKSEDVEDYDPLTGEIPDDRVSIPVDKVSPPVRYSREDIDGTLIQAEDFKVYVARGAITSISNNDEITLNGISANIISASPVYSGTEIAMWVLQCRRG